MEEIKCGKLTASEEALKKMRFEAAVYALMNKSVDGELTIHDLIYFGEVIRDGKLLPYNFMP